MDDIFDIQKLKTMVIKKAQDPIMQEVKRRLTSYYNYEHSIYKAQTYKNKKQDKDKSAVVPDDIIIHGHWNSQIVDGSIQISFEIDEQYAKQLNAQQRSSLFMEFNNAKKRMSFGW